MNRQRRHPQITVIGNSQASPEAMDLAHRVGTLLAKLGCTVISGGRGGIMQAVSRGASEAGGRTVGILPGDDLQGGNDWLDIVIPTGIGFARNSANVLAADVVIAIGGASGTLCEIAYAWMYGKPILAMAEAGGWAQRLAGEALDDRREDRVERADSIDELEQLLRKHLPNLPA